MENSYRATLLANWEAMEAWAKEGKPVQLWRGYRETWEDDPDPVFTGRELKYRVKPEEHTREVWINVYPDDCPWDHQAHATRAVANKAASPQRIACIHRTIKWHDGEGLE